MALTPSERQAQRVLLGVVNAGSARLSRDGLAIWRAKGAEEWQAGAAELTSHLDVLGVPYTLAIARGPSKRTASQVGVRIDVAWADLDRLERWLPSLRRLIEALEAQDGPKV